jgi:hypothetical protein
MPASPPNVFSIATLLAAQIGYVSNLMRLPQHRRWIREEIAIAVKLEK